MITTLTSLGMEFRRAGHSHFLITVCGSWVIDDRKPNLTTHYGRNTDHRYLTITSRPLARHPYYLHRLVAIAWVHNPAPGEFREVDHINHQTQDNRASNLRWINRSLNLLNKNRKSYASFRRKRGRRGGYWMSRVQFQCQPYNKGFDNEEDAISETKTRINDLFFEAYDLAVSANPEEDRAPWLLYWRSSNPTELRPGFFDP